MPLIAAILCIHPQLPGTADDSAPQPQPGQLLNQAVDAIERLPAARAAVRYMVRGPDGRKLTATGQCEELGDGPDRLARLELHFPIAGGKPFRLLQINGGQTLWTVRDLGGEPRIGRRAIGPPDTDTTPRDDDPIAPLTPGTGGVSGWLAWLGRDYEFHHHVAGVLHRRTGAVRVVQLQGHLAPATRQRLGLDQRAPASDQRAPGSDEPAPAEMLPRCVRLNLGADDLLPRRAEFYRTAAAERPLAAIDFTWEDTASDPPDRDRFRFDPGEHPVTNE